jgi:hypothetical protein
MSHAPRARIFISCGQSRGTDEEKIATEISRRLEALGFDPYVAVAEQTLRGLRENIFEQLRKSEYFVFIDFKREALVGTTPPIHRGSLFSHQELAIASFLDIDVIALQEDEIKPKDGIISFLQTNAMPFKDRHFLPSIVSDIVRERGWDPSWRKELVMERRLGEFTDAAVVVGGHINGMARYFHIDVHNQHQESTARNCYVFLEKMRRLDSDTEIQIRTVEFKWAGTSLPNVGIAPRTAREFDAFFILHDAPSTVRFNAFVDSSEYIPQVPAVGKYEFTYVVTADNFPVARRAFTLNLNSVLNETTLDPA